MKELDLVIAKTAVSDDVPAESERIENEYKDDI